MSNRLIQLLVLAAALFGTGATVVAITGLGGASSNPVAAATPTTAPETMIVLPAVVVRPEAEIPVLGEITVSPSHAERVAAGLEVPASDDALDRVAERVRSSSRALLPGGGFAMPYYSFGKPLQHANKE
ncbi:hypothetical protein [Dokdonella sp.]|uniref:hypothetical protein n=1 Tax=Dokdonella sp. TaxID=2291710 RepID=UPI001B2ED870|nr:hypothetical protein [Dokdonella sp.]MBO9662439.1 hypothetical protein [Dokdonella sp.]